MTWTFALFIAALCALYSLGYLTACVVNAPLLKERDVPQPEHPQVEVWNNTVASRHLRVVAFPSPALGPTANSGRIAKRAEEESAPPSLYDWQQDAEALGWLEGA